jgi:hypothetical protein
LKPGLATCPEPPAIFSIDESLGWSTFRILQLFSVRQVFAAIGDHTAGREGADAPVTDSKPETRPVKTHQSTIDQRPFRSKADQEREVALQTQYHRLAIPAVVAAVQPHGGSNDNRMAQKQVS